MTEPSIRASASEAGNHGAHREVHRAHGEVHRGHREVHGAHREIHHRDVHYRKVHDEDTGSTAQLDKALEKISQPTMAAHACVPTVSRQRWEGHEFRASLGCTTRPCLKGSKS